MVKYSEDGLTVIFGNEDSAPPMPKVVWDRIQEEKKIRSHGPYPSIDLLDEETIKVLKGIFQNNLSCKNESLEEKQERLINELDILKSIDDKVIETYENIVDCSNSIYKKMRFHIEIQDKTGKWLPDEIINRTKKIEDIDIELNCMVIKYFYYDNSSIMDTNIFTGWKNDLNFFVHKDSRKIMQIYHNSQSSRGGYDEYIKRDDYDFWRTILLELPRFADEKSINNILEVICDEDKELLSSLNTPKDMVFKLEKNKINKKN